MYVQLGMSALMLASENGHLQAVELLIEKGADLNLQDKKVSPMTTLFLVLLEYIFFLSSVYNKYMLPCIQDSSMSALMLALENGHLRAVELLIEKGADLNQRDWVSLVTPLLSSLILEALI